MSCEEDSASVILANCLLKDKGISFSLLHLNDKTCKGEMDDVTHMVTFTFNSKHTCGTLVKVGILTRFRNLLSAFKSLKTLKLLIRNY